MNWEVVAKVLEERADIARDKANRLHGPISSDICKMESRLLINLADALRSGMTSVAAKTGIENEIPDDRI